jgi:pimeloyl-ACP methyl ester carboxylesterase
MPSSWIARTCSVRGPGRPLRCSLPPELPVGCAAWSSAAAPLRSRFSLGGVLKDWVEAPDLEEFRHADPRRLLGDALSSIGQYTLADAVREDYLSSYQGNRMAESMRYVRSYPTELPVLSGLLPQVDAPVQIIAGTHDTAVPAVNAEYLHQRLPHSKLNIIDSGHFSWEDAPGEYAGLVTRWWGGGYMSGAAKE